MSDSVFRLVLCLAVAGLFHSTVEADDAATEAAETAEVFVYGRESQNEDLLREISDPDQYDAMAKERSESGHDLNENVRVKDVELIEVEGDRAVARATYKNIHGKGSKQTDVQLKRVDGKWQVTTPPEPAKE